MRRFLICLGLLLLIASNATADDAAVHVEAQVFPPHGLPALPFVVKVTLVNDGQKPARFDGPSFCLEITNPDGKSFPCGPKDYSDFGQLPFGRRQDTVPLTLDARASRVFFINTGDLQMHVGPRTLKPGKYTLRVRFLFSDTPSTAISYVVDEPQGENRTVWQRMAEVAAGDDPEQGTMFEVDERMRAVYAAHPQSDYAKLRD